MMTYEMIATLYKIEKDHKGSKTIYQITLERGVVLTIVIGDREDITEVFNKYIKPKKFEPIDTRPYSYSLSDRKGRAPSDALIKTVKERLSALDFTSMYSSMILLGPEDTLDVASKRDKVYSTSDEEEE